MKYSRYSIYITTFKILSSIIFTNILAINNTEFIIVDNLVECEGRSILEKVKDINQSLTSSIPILSLIYGICVQSNKIFPDGIDHLNFGDCEKLESFQLTFNGIKEVPDYIISFKCITYLCFLGNKLTSSCFVIITWLNTLRTLDLRKNLIEMIPSCISKLDDLEELIFDGNPFIYISPKFYKLRLKKLRVENGNTIYDKNRVIKNDTVSKMINDFLEIEDLETLMFCGSNLSDFSFKNKEYHIKKLALVSCGLYKIPESILKLKRLDHLNLSHNKFATVPLILSILESLKELDLEGNPITSYQNVFFNSLETFHMEWNGDSKGIISIKNTNSSHNLKNLHIYVNSSYHNNIQFDKDNMIDLECLYQYGDIIYNISRLENLRELGISIQPYEDPDFLKTLFITIRNLKSLEFLSLEELDHQMLLDDKICDIGNHGNLKKLHIFWFFVEDITCFSKLKNLELVCFEHTEFRESKKKVHLYLRQNKIEVTYKNCEFNSTLN